MNTIRASDAEREDVARILQQAAGAGRLSAEEAGERLAQASSARFREELTTLIADLPEATDLHSPPIAYRRPPFGAWLLWGLLRLGVAATLLIGFWAFFGLGWFFFWPMWPLAFLFFAAFVARGRWRWRRRMYWGRPYGTATRNGV